MRKTWARIIVLSLSLSVFSLSAAESKSMEELSKEISNPLA